MDRSYTNTSDARTALISQSDTCTASEAHHNLPLSPVHQLRIATLPPVPVLSLPTPTLLPPATAMYSNFPDSYTAESDYMSNGNGSWPQQDEESLYYPQYTALSQPGPPTTLYEQNQMHPALQTGPGQNPSPTSYAATAEKPKPRKALLFSPMKIGDEFTLTRDLTRQDPNQAIINGVNKLLNEQKQVIMEAIETTRVELRTLGLSTNT
ncbi:hypothetical protein M406DRAFT_74126 [Cryphonectria parasitica EP155]|uniref:Uncharacterized protein n=1 Tax=Cryphonectria parasitica (strain ATCC 38755 / EP155) TaxID=660469 RepID=A0A9P5CLP0_CRYP1|nr:uncharacterized protein M406DRAFT_74126 [Cryphonectria parasitica EP155]KAF3763534.1 hypothetical protein M406DRAFT_74126 [Cryphonectria parasitica EP155]